MASEIRNEKFWSPRFVLALVVSAVVLLVVFIFGLLAIIRADDVGAAAKDVFTFT